MDTALRLQNYYPKDSQINPQKRVWVFPFEAYDPKVANTHGKLACYLAIEYPDGLIVEVDFGELLQNFVDSYYESSGMAVFDGLRESALNWKEYVAQNLHAHGIPLDHVTISFVAMSLWGEVLYLVAFGNARCVLRRAGLAGDIYSGANERETVIVSGYVCDNDELFVGLIDQRLENSPPLERGESVDLIALVEKAGVYAVLVQDELVPSYEDERLLVMEENLEGEFVLQETDYTEDLQDEVVVDAEKTSVNNRLGAVFGLIKKPMLPIIRFFTHRRLVFLGTVVLIVFFGIVFFGRDFERIWRVQEQVSEQKNSFYPGLKARYEELVVAKDLNPVRVQRSLRELESEIVGLPVELQNDVEVVALLEEVQELYAQMTGTFKLTDLNYFFDLTTVSVNGEGERLDVDGEILVVTDKKQSVVYRVDLKTKAARAVIGRADLGGVLEDAIYRDGEIYALSNENVTKLNAQDTVPESVIKRFSGWGEPKYLDYYANQLYVFDVGRSQIWKYVPRESGELGDPLSYLATDGSEDLGGVRDLKIDGYVWVAKEDRILKYASGRQEQFALATAPEPISSITAIDTLEEHDYLYLLDGESGSVYVYRKDTGGYVGRIVAEPFAGATDIVYSSQTKQLYVVNKKFLYNLDVPDFPNK